MSVYILNRASMLQACELGEQISLADCIVPRDHDAPNSFYNSTTSQKEYMTRCADICYQLNNELKRRPAFLELLNWLGVKRSIIAQGSNQASEFGVLRSYTVYGTVRTPLLDHYAPLLDRIYQIKEDDPTMEWEFFDMNPESFNIGTRIGYDSVGNKIRLTKYAFTRSSNKKSSFPDSIAHTSQEHLKNSLAVCERLYFQILDSRNLEESRLKIAELHWWMSNACPYKRGSASCAEILIAALMQYKNISLKPYVKGVFVDRMALVTSLEEFIQLYPSFRES